MGSFTMGSSADEQAKAIAAGLKKEWTDRENPLHQVQIDDPLAVAKTEVTRGEFKRFVKASDYKTDAERSGGCWTLKADGSAWELKVKANWQSPGFEQGDDHPVVCVSWNDAQAYVKWLNRRIGISITRGQVSHHGAALKLREDPRFTALVGRFGSKSTVLESDFGCNGYASRRATPQRVGITALTSHQLMR